MKRAVFVIDKGVLTHFAVDESKFKDTSAEAVLNALWMNINIYFKIRLNIIIYFKIRLNINNIFY